IGVDGGTESLRAGVFDLQGRPRAVASSAYPTRFLQPTWPEQNPDDWWRALGLAVRQAYRPRGLPPRRAGSSLLAHPRRSAGTLWPQGWYRVAPTCWNRSSNRGGGRWARL